MISSLKPSLLFLSAKAFKSAAKFAWYGYDFNGAEFWASTNGPLTLAEPPPTSKPVLEN